MFPGVWLPHIEDVHKYGAPLYVAQKGDAETVIPSKVKYVSLAKIKLIVL